MSGVKWIVVKVFFEDGGIDVDILEVGEWVLVLKDVEGNFYLEMVFDVVNNLWGGGLGFDEWYRDMVNVWCVVDIFFEFLVGNMDFFILGGSGFIVNLVNYLELFVIGVIDINKKFVDFFF